MLGGGIQNRFALSPNLAVSLSIGITLTNANFDNTGSGFRFGGLYDVTVGIVYNIFNFQPTQKKPKENNRKASFIDKNTLSAKKITCSYMLEKLSSMIFAAELHLFT